MSGYLFIPTAPDLDKAVSISLCSTDYPAVSTLLLLKFLFLPDKEKTRDGQEEFISSRQSLLKNNKLDDM